MGNQVNKQSAGKAPVFQGVLAYFPRAIKEVAMVSLYGKEKYNVDWDAKGWRVVPYADLQDAQCRHILDQEIEGTINHTDGGVRHQAQVCWEALAVLENMLSEEFVHTQIKEIEEEEALAKEKAAEFRAEPKDGNGKQRRRIGQDFKDRSFDPYGD